MLILQFITIANHHYIFILTQLESYSTDTYQSKVYVKENRIILSNSGNIPENLS